jgi:16S rRNA processing protein RimM
MSEQDAEFITIAKLVKTQGRKGDVAAELFTDFPERFAERRHLQLWLPNGSRRSVELEDFWPHKGQMVLKFAGVDSISEAELLKGAEVQVRREERTPLEAGSFYISDLLGCKVFATEGGGASREAGVVRNFFTETGSVPLLEVVEGGREHLIPWVPEYLERVDLEGREIHLRLPEGLLDLEREA